LNYIHYNKEIQPIEPLASFFTNTNTNTYKQYFYIHNLLHKKSGQQLL